MKEHIIPFALGGRHLLETRQLRHLLRHHEEVRTDMQPNPIRTLADPIQSADPPAARATDSRRCTSRDAGRHSR